MKSTRVITTFLVLAATLACGRKKQPDIEVIPPLAPTRPERRPKTLRTARMPISFPFAMMKSPKV